MVVDSFYGVARRWTPPHIFEEILKAMKPSHADCYAARPVIFVPLIIFVIATIFHLAPSSVFWPLPSSATCSMLQARGEIGFPAPATFSCTARQMIPLDNDCFPANTNAEPLYVRGARNSVQNPKPKKLFPSEIYEARHSSTLVHPGSDVNAY